MKGNPAVKKGTGNWPNECCENLVNYMKTRLGQGNAVAANKVTNWIGTCYITTLIGAFLADAYLGRYWTIASFMTIYILGLAMQAMTSSVKGLVPSSCDNGGVCHPTEPQTAAVFVALYLVALGTGGIKPCVSSFGADQFDESDAREQKSKSSFFNWFYFSINLGALVASSVMVYVQTHVGWGWGFGIPAAVMAVAVATFFLGTPLYRHQRPGGSPLTRIAQVLVAAARKWDVAVPADTSQLHETADGESGIAGSRKLEHTDQFRFLDKSAVETAGDKEAPAASAWRLCTVTQVEELKTVARLLPVWATGIVLQAAFSQMSTMFVLQGNTVDLRMGPKFSIPSASLTIFDTLSIVALVPVYDRLVVPAARSVTGRPRGFTQLQRMGVGLAVSVFAMLAAGALEVVRLHAVGRRGLYGARDVVPISIFWQVPQYLTAGAAEVFALAPDAMRSLCTVLALTTHALGNYLSTVSSGGSPDNLNRGHLDYFFWLLAVLSLINFLVYLVIARWYKYKKRADYPDAKGDENPVQ
ncbi:hypothetical protein SETIT_5G098600v2 [Setaria italica]|uniref:Major facilitator superfamily (MFS) profile domain-containing protein n=1 Tax=Setaria italica TaxID=4555 RepID=A0A368R4X4_SETIT|nr:hypothetical protein SETIT_5G098600v2 [Setaria italica]